MKTKLIEEIARAKGIDPKLLHEPETICQVLMVGLAAAIETFNFASMTPYERDATVNERAAAQAIFQHYQHFLPEQTANQAQMIRKGT